MQDFIQAENYFCGLIKKYTDKKKISWCPKTEKMNNQLSKLKHELKSNHDIIHIRSLISENEIIFFNPSQPDYVLVLDHQHGTNGFKACWIRPLSTLTKEELEIIKLRIF